MKKVLIFGSAGMIGHIVYNYLDSLKKYTLLSSAANKKISEDTFLLDIRDSKKVKDYIESVKPDYAINCAGLLIQESEDNIEDAIQINSLFPNILSRLGKEFDFKLIQISTDCVFSGNDGNYTEDSVPDGSSVYARTKALGEIKNERDLTIRTSTIGPELSPDGSGLLNWFLSQKGEIFGFDRAFWSGVTTLELAKAIEFFLNTDLTGLYNLSSEKKISKYDLLLLMQKIWERTDIKITAKSSFVNDKSLYNIREGAKYDVKGYEVMLKESYQWVLQNKNSYQHYFN